MNNDNRLIFEAFLEAVEKKAYMMISYSDRCMSQIKITAVDARRVPVLLEFGLDSLIDPEDRTDPSRFEYVEVYAPDNITIETAIKLSYKTDIHVSYTGDDNIEVCHNIQSIFNNLVNNESVSKEHAEIIMRRLIDNGVVDFFYYGEGNHLQEQEQVIFYKTSANSKDWYKVNATGEVAQVIGRKLSDATGTRDFEQPYDPNREDPDDEY